VLSEAGVHTDDISGVGLTEAELTAVLATRYRQGVSIEQLSRDTGARRRSGWP
jgi:hypothetical protein